MGGKELPQGQTSEPITKSWGQGRMSGGHSKWPEFLFPGLVTHRGRTGSVQGRDEGRQAAVDNECLLPFCRCPVPLHDTPRSIPTADTGLPSPSPCYMGIFRWSR